LTPAGKDGERSGIVGERRDYSKRATVTSGGSSQRNAPAITRVTSSERCYSAAAVGKQRTDCPRYNPVKLLPFGIMSDEVPESTLYVKYPDKLVTLLEKSDRNTLLSSHGLRSVIAKCLD
jgi:hypothetical protein